MFTFEAHPAGLNTFCMAFVPGEPALLATAGREGVRFWDLVKREKAHEVALGADSVAALSFAPDGERLAVCYGEFPAHIDVVDWRRGKQLGRWDFLDRAQCAVFSPDGKDLAAGGFGPMIDEPTRYAVRRVNLATGAQRRTLVGHDDQTGFLDYSPDGRLLASGAADQRAIIWDLASRKPLATFQHKKLVWGVAFSRDGQVLATTGGWTVHLIEVASGRKLGQLRAHQDMVYGLHFSPDGRTLATASADGSVRFWDYRTRRRKGSFDWGLGQLHEVRFSPDGQLAAVGSAKGWVAVWDVDE